MLISRVTDPTLKIRKEFSRQIAETLAENIMPWRRSPFAEGQPTNVGTGAIFSGINLLLLQLAALKGNFRSKWWGTCHQWSRLNGRLQTDASPTSIVLYTPSTDHDGPGWHFRIKRSTVYNLDQIRGADHLRPALKEGMDVDWSKAERLIARSGARINFVYGNSAAYNRPPQDDIIFPLKQQFIEGSGGLPGYYDSLFHELMHWSEPRQLWLPDQKWDEPTAYAINELRAEIGAGWLATELGIPSSTMNRNHEQYLDCWLRAMKQDPELIFKVAMAAYQGVDYLRRRTGYSALREAVVPIEEA